MKTLCITLTYLLAVSLAAVFAVSNHDDDLYCTDFKGRRVQESDEFVPREGDPCMTCTCQEGFPVMCTSVLCSPPDCVLLEVIDDECCSFNCIEPPIENPGNHHNMSGTIHTKTNSANLGLRLVASTVTSLLILALLLFMIHRLRQRRTLITMRRLDAERQEEDAVAYMTQIDQVDIGLEFPPYEDPPPPYTPPKPYDIPMGESPPPYEENPSAGHHGGNNNNNTEGGGSHATRNGGAPSVRAPQARGRAGEQSHQQGGGTVGRQNQRNEEMSAQTAATHAQNGGAVMVADPDGQAGSIISRTRVIESLLGRASSSASSSGRAASLPHAVGRKKDKKSARKSSSNDSYGLSVALATLGGREEESPETSPSRVMVHMRNNSPQSSLVKIDYAPSTSGALGPLPGVANVEGLSSPEGATPGVSTAHGFHNNMPPAPDKPRHCPESWTQFIKKSDSIEIKHGSNSPRNSFYQDDTSGDSGSGGGSRRRGARDSAPPQMTSSVSLMGAAGTSGERPGTSGDLMSKSTSAAMESRDSVPRDPSRQSMPPMILDLPIREANKRGVLTPETVTSPESNSSRATPSGASSTRAIGSSAGAVGGVGNMLASPGGSTAQSPGLGLNSPQSPFPSHTTRSGSMTSNGSIFSVCSETGERKNPHANVPYTLRNDVQYPLSPLTSLYSAPMPPPRVPSVDRSPTAGRDDSDTTSSHTASAGGSSSGGAAASRNTTSANSADKDAKCAPRNNDVKPAVHQRPLRKIIYREADELDNSSSPDSSDANKRQSANSQPKTKSKDEGDSDKVDVKDKGSLRKNRQKKKGSSNNSPEQRNKVEKSSSFKQYGFVDSPEVVKACQEKGVIPCKGDKIPDPALGERVRRRSNSRERRKSRENSRERNAARRQSSGGGKSRESSKSRSRSRSRSRGRKSESPGTERRRKRRSRQSGPAPADIPSDVAVVNGDLDYSARRHKSRSPGRSSRRHRAGSSSNPGLDYNLLARQEELARQEDEVNANTAPPPDTHDNSATSAARVHQSVTNFRQEATPYTSTSSAAAVCKNTTTSQQPSHSMVVDR